MTTRYMGLPSRSPDGVTSSSCLMPCALMLSASSLTSPTSLRGLCGFGSSWETGMSTMDIDMRILL
ncbi:Uncharacterised protein [Bifidobacterium longum subsp. infantis]|nr:Uncharacterised protein [Bifidobacterium longum subsp. infantis]